MRMARLKTVAGLLLVLFMQLVFLFGSSPFILLGMDAIQATMLWDVLACLAVAAWFRRKRPAGWRGRPVRHGPLTDPRRLGPWMAVLAAYSMAASACMSMSMLFLESIIEDPGMAARTDVVESSGVLWYLLLSVFVAPFAEELFYRIYTYGALRRLLGAWPAAALSAILFGAGHTTLGHLVTGTMFGFLLCMVYEYTGSWWASVFCHFVYNFSVIAVSMSDGLVSASTTTLGGVLSTVASIVLVLGSCAPVVRKETCYGLYGVPGVPDRDEANHP